MRIAQKAALLMAGMVMLTGCAFDADNRFNSTLWMQSSAEYKAGALQTYNTAKRHIDAALNNTGWSAALEQTGDAAALPPAVIMDIDETVLDNGRYQAQLVIDGTEFDPDTWDAWIALRAATAVPGAVDFVHAAKQRGVEVIFITNRQCRPRKGGDVPCPQEQDTIDNLETVGITGVAPEHILLKGERESWSSEKSSRRAVVCGNYRVIMLFGDDLGDFLPDVKKNVSPLQRETLVLQHQEKWGHKWYAFSNPSYGSWLRVLEAPESRLVGF